MVGTCLQRPGLLAELVPCDAAELYLPMGPHTTLEGDLAVYHRTAGFRHEGGRVGSVLAGHPEVAKEGPPRRLVRATTPGGIAEVRVEDDIAW